MFTTTKLRSSRCIRNNYGSKTRLGFRLWPLATRPPRIVSSSRTSCPLQSETFARSTTNSPMSTETTWNPGIDSKCRRYRHRALDRQVHYITVLWAVRRHLLPKNVVITFYLGCMVGKKKPIPSLKNVYVKLEKNQFLEGFARQSKKKAKHCVVC